MYHHTCPSLAACLNALDRVVPGYDDGEGSHADILANKLRRFGDPQSRSC